jgi:hypothetical protein
MLALIAIIAGLLIIVAVARGAYVNAAEAEYYSGARTRRAVRFAIRQSRALAR